MSVTEDVPGPGPDHDLVVLVGNPRPGSRTRILAEATASALAATLAELGAGVVTPPLAVLESALADPKALAAAWVAEQAASIVDALRAGRP